MLNIMMLGSKAFDPMIPTDFLAFYFFVGDGLGGATEWISYLLGWKLIVREYV